MDVDPRVLGDELACRHHHPGQRFVTTSYGDQRVEPLGMHHQLDRVGNNLTGDEGGTHPLVTHGDAIGDGDSRKRQPDSTRFRYTDLGVL